MIKGVENLDFSFHLCRHIQLLNSFLVQNFDRHLDSSSHMSCHYNLISERYSIRFTFPKDPFPSVSSILQDPTYTQSFCMATISLDQDTFIDKTQTELRVQTRMPFFRFLKCLYFRSNNCYWNLNNGFSNEMRSLQYHGDSR